uniref:RRM domain-containing protein n=1 Tax=Ciona intestinalis TaxID=7719 RepID=H2XRI8_CIOIN
MFMSSNEHLCLRETKNSITSKSTVHYVPQPVYNKTHYIQNRLFISGFSNDTTHKDIMDTFRPYGQVIEANIVQSASDYGKRYGFVTFHSIASADTILRHYNLGRKFMVNGKYVTIQRALFKPKNKIENLRKFPTNHTATVNSNEVVQLPSNENLLTEFRNETTYYKQIPPNNPIIKLPPLPPSRPFIRSGLSNAAYIPATFPCTLSGYPALQNLRS